LDKLGATTESQVAHMVVADQRQLDMAVVVVARQFKRHCQSLLQASLETEPLPHLQHLERMDLLQASPFC